jgi:hypothetical protein
MAKTRKHRYPDRKKRTKRHKNTKRKKNTKGHKSAKRKKEMKVLSEDQEYNVYIICKNKKIFNERVKTLEKYKGKKIHTFTYVKAVFLKDTVEDRERVMAKLSTRHNTLMKNRLRKLGCIFAHRNAFRKIVKAKTNHNLILEEDATLDHVLPNPPKEDTYMGGWIVPPQITLAGKKRIRIPKLKAGLNEIKYDKFRILMTHSYYLRDHEKAKEILDIIEGPKKIKNYDVFLTNEQFMHEFYYPAIFVQSQHISDIDGKVNKNDQRAKDYDLLIS